MNKKLILLLPLFLSSIQLIAQNDSLFIEFVGKETFKKSMLNIPEKYSEIWDYNDSIVAYQSPFRESSVKLAPKQTVTYNNKQFDVETLMGTLIAPKAGILVKYGSGDPLIRANRHEFKVIYYDLDKGIKMFELPYKYKGAGCSISENGFLAMTGRLLGYKPMTIEGSHISLYDKNGKEIFTKPMGSDNWVRDIQISPKGSYIALVYTTLRAQPPNERFNLMILKNDGTVLFDKRYKIPFHHLIFSPDGKYFLGITVDYICLVDLKKQALIWEQQEFYLSGRSPVIFLDENKSILIETSRREDWNLHLLDIETGKEFQKIALPEKLEPVNKRTMFRKNTDEIQILTPSGTYNYKLRTKE